MECVFWIVPRVSNVFFFSFLLYPNVLTSSVIYSSLTILVKAKTKRKRV